MAAALATPTCMAEGLKPIETLKIGEALGGDLKHFLEVAMQVAQIDEAIMKARASAPSQEDSEAFKWHEVSIKALMWTRSSLLEQQGNALGQLKNSVVSQQPSVLSSGEPVSSLSATAKPF